MTKRLLKTTTALGSNIAERAKFTQRADLSPHLRWLCIHSLLAITTYTRNTNPRPLGYKPT